MKTKQPDAPPYVDPQVVKGRLVRICPECQTEIVEHTDPDGMVSNRYLEHYEQAHPIVVEPERVQKFVLVSEPKVGDPRKIAAIALDFVRENCATHRDGRPVSWALVDRIEDLPEGAPTVQSADVLIRILDDDGGGIPLCQRQGDQLVDIPVPAEEHERWLAEHMECTDELMERHLAANRVLVARREHRLPQLKRPLPEGEAGLAVWDAWYERRKPLEAKITKKLDEADRRSWTRLRNGRSDWWDPLNEAIIAAGITEDEIKAEIQRVEDAKRRWEVTA